MSPDKEIELCEAVASISADLKNSIRQQTDLVRKLEEHTKTDSDNFEKLSEKLDVLAAKDNQDLGAAKNKAFLWHTVTSGGLIAVWEVVKRISGN